MQVTFNYVCLTHLCPPLGSTFAVRETASLGQQMLNATVGINGLKGHTPLRVFTSTHSNVSVIFSNVSEVRM